MKFKQIVIRLYSLSKFIIKDKELLCLCLCLCNCFGLASLLAQGNWEAFVAANFIIIALGKHDVI